VPQRSGRAANARIALARLQQRITLLELRRRRFVSAGILLEHGVVILDGLRIIPLAKFDFGNVELGVAGQVGVAIKL